MKRRHRETGACLDREKLGFVNNHNSFKPLLCDIENIK